jgi:hypothetical protein
MGLHELLREMNEGARGMALETCRHLSVEELRRRHALLEEKHEFKPGDVVQWKQGLKDKRVPEYGVPVIVVEVKPGLVDPTDQSGTPYFQCPCDLVIGFGDPNGDFILFHNDARRFEPYTES